MSRSEQEKAHARLKLWMLVAASSLAAALAVAAVRSYRTPWRSLQERFTAETGTSSQTVRGINQIRACNEEIDRCPTCHLGIENAALAGKNVPLPFRAHGPGIRGHLSERVGCSSCHGGTGRALDPDTAHARTGTEEVDSLMREPHIQASCARCHVPGSSKGQERLVQGALLYLGLGCSLCHPLGSGGRGGWDFGPDLKEIGRKSLDYLKTSLIDPEANFEGSTMPSFKHSLEKEPAATESLLIYLESLALERCDNHRKDSEIRNTVTGRCAVCHAGGSGRAGGRMSHKCVYIKERAEELKCSRCHSDGVPEKGAAKGFCPMVSQHRRSCVACHDEA